MQDDNRKKSLDNIPNGKIISGLMIVGIFLVHKAWLVAYAIFSNGNFHAHAVLVSFILVIMVGLVSSYRSTVNSYKEFEDIATQVGKLNSFNDKDPIASDSLQQGKSKKVVLKNDNNTLSRNTPKELPF